MAIVLAAGRSTRMSGHNKLLLPWGEKCIVQAVVETLLDASLAEIVVVTGHQRDKVEILLRDYPLHFAPNPHYAEGLSTSIRRGVEAAGKEVAGYLFALGDMPRISSATIDKLCTTFLQHADPIVVPTADGKRGNPVLFASSYREDLRQLKGDQGAKPLVHKYADKVKDVPVDDPGIFIDMDTPQAYHTAVNPP